MSDFKFNCPACGQHISCSSAYCDQVIHCPSCRTDLRVPCSANPNPDHETPSSKVPLPANDSGPGISSAINNLHKAPPAVNEKELHCRCPVCQSKLRIPAAVAEQSADIFPSAELVVKASAPLHDHDSAKSAAPTEMPAAPLTEREQKIAAERAARDISLYPKMKPRLDLVLGEKSTEKPKDGENPSWMKEAA